MKTKARGNGNGDGNGAGDSVRSRRKYFSDRLTRSTGTFTLERTDTMVKIGKLKLRGKTDDLPQYVSGRFFHASSRKRSMDHANKNGCVEIGGSRPQLSPSLPRPLALLPTSSRSQLWFRNGGSRCPIMGNYPKGRMTLESISRIHAGEF